MTLTDRDRRILLFLIPIVVLVAYWFLLLSPKRDDLATAETEKTAAEQRRDTAVQRVATLERARQTFASDYAAVVRLGKAIPGTVDSSSLLVQLDEAARGTGIDLSSVQFGERLSGITLTPAAGQGQSAGSEAAQPEGNAAAAGVAAATGPGQAVEAAGEGAEGAENAQAQQEAQQGQAEGAQPTDPEAPASTAPPAGLDAIPLTFIFRGSYFDLADFLHRVKRFVLVQDDRIFVRGRLLTIDSMTFEPDTSGTDQAATGDLTTNVTATVYLSPRSEGTTAGATPAGPAGAQGEAPAAPADNETARRSPLPTATARSVR